MTSGTPPRRRGRARELADHERVRNTPALAGRVGSRERTTSSRSEHPRVGGEDGRLPVPSNTQVGTPPCRRGGPVLVRGDPREDRSTPASAGRTRRSNSPRSARAKHPRVGGEDAEMLTHLLGRYEHPRVGRRTSSPATLAAHSSEHPRIGGEDRAGHGSILSTPGSPLRRRGGEAGQSRNTPASAGRTGSAARCASRRTEHPRVGGEDYDRMRMSDYLAGTPPRRRGGLRPGNARA